MTSSLSLQRQSLRTILLGNVHQEVANAPRVTPLVVVPGDQLDEGLVQLDAGIGIENRGSRVANEIGRDDLLISVLDDVLVSTLGSFFDGFLDFIIGSFLLEADDEVDDGDIEGRDTESKTAVDRRLDKRTQDKISDDMTYVSLPLSEGMTLPTAFAAPVEEGMMLLPTARPPRQSLWEGPSTVFWVAVVE
jgi:hypothetical protein